MLKLVATPIGDPGDITLRAIETLKNAEIVIGEERREVSTLLKRLGIDAKDLRLLNEHTDDSDVAELLELCRNKEVALVTDCGTPGFCDPGARLVDACRKAGISITANPGASSLMCLLSLAALEAREFYFAGFPPAEKEARSEALRHLVQNPRAVVMMDTPYRLNKLMQELAAVRPERRALLGMDLTSAQEKVLEGTLSELAKKTSDLKAEFILLLYPTIAQKIQAPKNSQTKAQDTRPQGANQRRFRPGRKR